MMLQIEYIIILLAVILFAVLMLKTNLFRRPGLKNKRRPLSLSRTQFGVWTLVIFCSYFYLLSAKKPIDIEGAYSDYEEDGTRIEITKSVGMLLGLSFGTASVAGIVDAIIGNSFSRSTSQIHRWQFLAIMIFVLLIYIRSLFYLQNYPELSVKLLILLGISSCYYLGIKFKLFKT